MLSRLSIINYKMAEAASNSGFVNINGRAMAVPVWDLVELAQHIQMVYFLMVWGNPVEDGHKCFPLVYAIVLSINLFL